MGDYSFEMNCECCECALFAVANADAQSWKDDANLHGGHRQVCASCGCEFTTEDDGIPVGEGGGVRTKNVSKPKLEVVTISGGARTGGEALYIQGKALDVGTLTVKFGGKTVQEVTNRTSTQARVVTPVGQYKLIVQEHLTRHTFSSVSGTFLVGDSITSHTNMAGTLRAVGGLDYWIGWDNLTSGPESLIGIRIDSSTGGAATIASGVTPSFIDGEGLEGQSSSARAAYREGDSFTADAPSTSFLGGEIVIGSASRARILLDPRPYVGVVDVSVENEYGQRTVGGVATGGFTYL